MNTLYIANILSIWSLTNLWFVCLNEMPKFWLYLALDKLPRRVVGGFVLQFLWLLFVQLRRIKATRLTKSCQRKRKYENKVMIRY